MGQGTQVSLRLMIQLLASKRLHCSTWIWEPLAAAGVEDDDSLSTPYLAVKAGLGM